MSLIPFFIWNRNTSLGEVRPQLTRPADSFKHASRRFASSVEIGIMSEAIATNFFTILGYIIELNTALRLLGVDINALQSQVNN